MVSNPVDVTGNLVNQPEFVRTVFTALAQTYAVDVVVVYAPGYLLDRMAEVMAEVCALHPRLFIAIDTGAATSRARLAEAGVPVFDDLGRATQAIGAYCLWLARRPEVARWAALRKSLAVARTELPLTSRMNEQDTKLLLAQYGVHSVSGSVGTDADEVVRAASTIGYPVALKILSPDIAHKTEVGGVKLNIADESELRAACEAIFESVKRHAPQAQVDGLLVQAMATGGVAELIAGVTHDAVFGPTLTVGLGGVLTEVYRDASHRLLPIDSEMVLQMLQGLRAWPLLDGFRGRPHGDVHAACDNVAALSRAAMALGPQAEEIEINPIQVRARGEGAFALDALVLVRDSH
jgi:acyl-CoA synthetase (NDP forming)